jgi:hypothetical protein
MLNRRAIAVLVWYGAASSWPRVVVAVSSVNRSTEQTVRLSDVGVAFLRYGRTDLGHAGSDLAVGALPPGATTALSTVAWISARRSSTRRQAKAVKPRQGTFGPASGSWVEGGRAALRLRP